MKTPTTTTCAEHIIKERIKANGTPGVDDCGVSFKDVLQGYKDMLMTTHDAEELEELASSEEFEALFG